VMASKVARETLASQQPLPVPLRSNHTQGTLSSFQGASGTLAQSYSFYGAPPLCFLSWEGTECGRGREMGRTSQNLLCARISDPM
uniref:Uncharacterized protein n=1 Tax=Prolemur simus TaxID=1328070 RepID=A0A8C9AHN8_PROSS